ncbi:MAG: transglutaminase-like domain-containing protein [archaeon]
MAEENEFKLCKYLLEKYADIINDREKRTIGEIKGLVDGTDLSVASFVADFKDSAYSFEADYENSLKQVFDFAKKEIGFAKNDLNVNYWLSPREILEIKVADDEDLAVFLCAAMRALGDESAEVIIAELDNLKTHAFVATEIKKDFLILDPSQEHKFETFKGAKIDVLKKYSFDEQKIKRFLYRFNSQKYEQFLE